MAKFLLLPGLTGSSGITGSFRINEANADDIQAQVDDAIANGTCGGAARCMTYARGALCGRVAVGRDGTGCVGRNG